MEQEEGVSWIKTIAHCAGVCAVLWLFQQLGLQVDATTAAIAIGIGALQLGYSAQRPAPNPRKPPVQE